MKKTIILLLSVVLFGGCAYVENLIKDPRIKEQEAKEAAEKAAFQAAAQEFNQECNLYLTASEEEPGYMQALYKGDISWETAIQNIQKFFEEQTQGKATLKNPSKTNKPLAFLIYDDAGVRVAAVQDFLLANQKFRDEECYKTLSEQKKTVEQMRTEIYGTFYPQEKSAFYKKLGLSIDENTTYPLALLAGVTSQQPDPKTIYILSGIKVLQVLNDGILINSYDGGLGYIKTLPNKSYVDNMTLYNVYVLPNGTKKYNNVLGATRTVYAFKELDMEAYYEKYAKGNFFFPYNKAANFDEEQEVQKFMLSLLEKK